MLQRPPSRVITCLTCAKWLACGLFSLPQLFTFLLSLLTYLFTTRGSEITRG